MTTENDAEYGKINEMAKSLLNELLESQDERQRRLSSLKRFTDGLRALVKKGAAEFGGAALEQAEQELRELTQSQERNKSDIADLHNVVEGAKGLVGDGESDSVPHKKQPFADVFGVTSTSLTASIRRFFGRSPKATGFTTGQVKDGLRNLDLSRYKSSPLVPIHNTLQRLVAQRELTSADDESGPRCYTALPLLYEKLESDEGWQSELDVEEHYQ